MQVFSDLGFLAAAIDASRLESSRAYAFTKKGFK
jgi:hypothetical protein